MRKFLYSLILPILLLSVNSCLTEEYDSENYLTPTVRCTKVEPISGSTGIVFSGEFENKSPRSVVVGSGFYYSLGSDFSSAVKVSSSAANGNVFTCELSLPEYEANYSVKAYISDGRHELLSDAVKYKTASFDSHVTLAVSSISADSDKHAAEITSIVSFDTGVALTERGVCYGTAPNPALSSDNISMASGTGSGKFFVTLSSLKEGCNYYVRSYVKSGEYIAYSEQQSFNTAVNVTGVSVSPTSSNITIGGTKTLTVTVSPSNATDKSVTWISDNPSIATVNNGVVTARSVGTATITVRSNSDNSKYATCKITVSKLVTSVTFNETTKQLKKGETFQLTAIVKPDDATDKSLTWESSNPGVATVTGNGLVKAVAEGSATITATANDGSGKYAKCKITVPKLVTSVTLSETSKQLTKGQTLQLKATVKPDDATDKTLTWVSDNTGVATVTGEGLVKAVAEGSVTIKATANDGSGKSATCSITVPRLVTSVTLNETTKQLNKGETFQLTANVLPTDATDKSLTWESSNPGVATVTGNGLVKAVAEGSATITATANDGSGKYAKCKINVVSSQTEINGNTNEQVGENEGTW